jgi:uncharacterized phage protein (TIGR01671 family)
MKRETKYKFWTGSEMLTEGFFINPDGIVWSWIDYKHTSSFVQKGELIQYTGLKDKNGTEIYEGDVVKYNRNEYYRDAEETSEVKYDGYGFAPMKYHRNIEDDSFYSCLISDIEVIGNVFENPELIPT